MVRSNVPRIRGSVGEMKKTSGMIRLEASSASVPKYCTKVRRCGSQPLVMIVS